ncbi:MAG: M24 family metallopeptidase [Thomasclavelia sp.]
MIAYGANGANRHHENDDSRLKPGDSIIIDMGCKYHRILFRYDKNSIL